MTSEQRQTLIFDGLNGTTAFDTYRYPLQVSSLSSFLAEVLEELRTDLALQITRPQSRI